MAVSPGPNMPLPYISSFIHLFSSYSQMLLLYPLLDCVTAVTMAVASQGSQLGRWGLRADIQEVLSEMSI